MKTTILLFLLLLNCVVSAQETIVLRSEFEEVGETLYDFNPPEEGAVIYSIQSGNSEEYYSIDANTGVLSIQSIINDTMGTTTTHQLVIDLSGTQEKLTVVDAYDYFISKHPEYKVLDNHQQIDTTKGSPYTAYNNLWGKGTATPNQDFRMATLVHSTVSDSIVFLWDVPSKTKSVWSYQSIIWGNRLGQRENVIKFPFQVKSIHSLVFDFDFEKLFGTEDYKIALNHFFTDEADLQPFSANRGDFFMVFDQVGTWVPPYPNDLGDTVIEGHDFARLYKTEGDYEWRRVIIKDQQRWLKGSLDLKEIYQPFLTAGYIDTNQYIPNIQAGIEVTDGFGAIRFNKVKFRLNEAQSTNAKGVFQSNQLFHQQSNEALHFKNRNNQTWEIFNFQGKRVLNGNGSKAIIQSLPLGAYQFELGTPTSSFIKK